jgi:NADPH-dependent 2,4-dienoyl-CoA reductase/sulfur reductase-like enzyme
MDRGQRAASKKVTIHWEGRPVEACAGDNVASALFAAGVHVLGRSRKFHRPVGLSGSFLAGVKGQVDGLPNQRLDQIPVRPGLAARAQNVWPNGRFDLLRLAGLIPRQWLRGGFEHPVWLPGGSWRFQVWESFLRMMAGGGDPVAADHPGSVLPGERLAVDVAVVGGGPSGRQAAVAAAASGRSVMLVSRSGRPGAIAAALGSELPPLPEGLSSFAGWEAAALYRRGGLLVCAPLDGGPAKLVDARRVVLATGRRSIPPLVPGADLPGVFDLRTAVILVHQHGIALGRSVLIGTGDLAALGARLAKLGADIVAMHPAEALCRIDGAQRIEWAVFGTGHAIACDSLIHAGPWRPDPSLPFQASADGEFRLAADHLPSHIELVGAAALAGEAVVHGPSLDDRAMVCPCMDVTVGEIRHLLATGRCHVEELKRLTGCGMGPCQGSPCWDLLAAALATITGSPPESFGHPSYRAPRGALTLAQAAGLADLVQPEAE